MRSTVCLFLADWKYRHAGLMALSAIGEGCHQQMEAILNEIVSFVLLFCSDPVRHTTLNLVVLYKYTAHAVHNDRVLSSQILFLSLMLQVLFCMVFILVSFFLLSTQGCGMLLATLLDKWPQTLPQPSRRNFMIRYLQ